MQDQGCSGPRFSYPKTDIPQPCWAPLLDHSNGKHVFSWYPTEISCLPPCAHCPLHNLWEEPGSIQLSLCSGICLYWAWWGSWWTLSRVEIVWLSSLNSSWLCGRNLNYWHILIQNLGSWKQIIFKRLRDMPKCTSLCFIQQDAENFSFYSEV